MKKKIKVYVAILTTGTVVDSQEYILRDLKELYKDHVEFVYPRLCVRRMFHDFARNMAVDDFLQTDCDVIWFLDSDITPCKYIMDLVAVHWDKWQYAGAVYPVFMTPTGCEGPEVLFTSYSWDAAKNTFHPARVPTEGQDFIDGIATGCLFIKREVFSKLEKPYFEFKFDPATRNMLEGEDLGFCRKLLDHGIKCFTDYSIMCKHQKNVDLLEVANYAIKYSNRQIEAFDAQIKVQVEASFKEAYQLGYKKGLEDKAKPKSSIHTQPTIWVPN